MGRRKQIRPRRSGVVIEKECHEAELSKLNGAQPGKDEVFVAEEPFFVEIDRRSWVLDEHYDVSEIVVLNLKVNEEFYGYTLTQEIYRDSRYVLRFKLSDVNEHLGRMKLGHWPVLSESNMCLEFVMKFVENGLEREIVMVSGTVDGPDEGVTGLVHLVSLKFLSIRPILGVQFLEGISSFSVRVEILKAMFNECESLLENTRQPWKKSMMFVMSWLRPEVMTSEARYGYNEATNVDSDGSVIENGDSYELKKHTREAPMLDVELRELVLELRPYQRRAAYWMVQQEKGDYKILGENGRRQIVSPLCMPLSLIDTSRRIYYNPFSGNISMHPICGPSHVSGGILADEMGLGKTVELLSCIVANRMSPSEDSGDSHRPRQVEWLKRVKRERVECICGAVTESYRYEGLWVQCDLCDAWQHGDCVNYSAKKRKTSESNEDVKCKEEYNRNSRKNRKRKNSSEVLETEGQYICHTCAALVQATESPIASGATLVVCPTPILLQWHAEILRHTKPGSLRICVYEGVKQTSFSDEPVIDIKELLNADIVLTTYDVLKEDLPHDSERHEGDRRLMRYQKKYPVVPTPLTRVLWWRICLDEAQMVEGNAASATELALRLHAKHRWCITGTPIQRKLDDLYGLLRFLQLSPFDVLRWWTDVISHPYEMGDAGAVAFTHSFFKQIMWRSSKAHVWDELQLPPQEECVSWISLSPIEEHFYQRQHETCVDDAREVVASFKDDVKKREVSDSLSSEPYITNAEAAKLFNSLLKLRQACCHPQVGSSGLRSLQKSPMTMEEILSVLIGKTRIEGEDELRKLVVALNGLAGIAMIEQDFARAVSLYKEALDSAECHSEDFRLDPLLNIHVHHNMAEALMLTKPSLCQNLIPEISGNLSGMGNADQKDKDATEMAEMALSDSSESPVPVYVQHLRAECESLKQKFLSVFASKHSVAQLEFRKSYEQVCDSFANRKHQHLTWWLDALHHIEQNKDSSSALIQKIGEALSGNLNKKSRTPSFRSITALRYYVQTGLDALEESRKYLLDRLLEIDQKMENPRGEDIIRVRFCKNCNSNYDGPPCTHCELDEVFQVYEARLFRLNKSNNGEVITSVEDAINMQKRKSALNQFYWNLSRPEKNSSLPDDDSQYDAKKRDAGEKVTVSKSPSDLEVVLSIVRNVSRGYLDREGISSAKRQLELLEGMRKEYAHARSLAIGQAQVLRAHDELNMATSRLRLRENEDDNSIDALSPVELDTANVENSSEKFLAVDALSRIKGQLRYLKGLAQSKATSTAENLDASTKTEVAVHLVNGRIERAGADSCPICQEPLENQKMVFQCGHVTCCKCLFALTDSRFATPGKSYGSSNSNRVLCPTCRQPTDFGNIAFADDKHGDPRGAYATSDEASVFVNGSYSTKIEAVTRRILWILSTDPKAKVLVFSSWNDVLDVLQHAFSANDIRYVRMKGGRKSQLALSHFRGERSDTKGSKRNQETQASTKTVQVLLLLIQHGANGLNLLEAQHVILVEPLLNPAAEAQAVGRVHRIGQERKTLVHRFIVKNTVEESIYKLNRSRQTNSFISGNRKNIDQPCLTLRDVESLFRVGAPKREGDCCVETQRLRDLPASVAAAIAAERRLLNAQNGSN